MCVLVKKNAKGNVCVWHEHRSLTLPECWRVMAKLAGHRIFYANTHTVVFVLCVCVASTTLGLNVTIFMYVDVLHFMQRGEKQKACNSQTLAHLHLSGLLKYFLRSYREEYFLNRHLYTPINSKLNKAQGSVQCDMCTVHVLKRVKELLRAL